MRAGYAAEDGAALHFTGERAEPGRRLAAARRAATASTSPGERVVEMRIATTYLGDRGAVPAAPLPEALSTAAA